MAGLPPNLSCNTAKNTDCLATGTRLKLDLLSGDLSPDCGADANLILTYNQTNSFAVGNVVVALGSTVTWSLLLGNSNTNNNQDARVGLVIARTPDTLTILLWGKYTGDALTVFTSSSPIYAHRTTAGLMTTAITNAWNSATPPDRVVFLGHLHFDGVSKYLIWNPQVCMPLEICQGDYILIPARTLPP